MNLSAGKLSCMTHKDPRTFTSSRMQALLTRKPEIKAMFGEPLDWQRLDNYRASAVTPTIKLGGWRDPENWPAIQEATTDAMVRLEKALKPAIASLQI